MATGLQYLHELEPNKSHETPVSIRPRTVEASILEIRVVDNKGYSVNEKRGASNILPAITKATEEWRAPSVLRGPAPKSAEEQENSSKVMYLANGNNLDFTGEQETDEELARIRNKTDALYEAMKTEDVPTASAPPLTVVPDQTTHDQAPTSHGDPAAADKARQLLDRLYERQAA